MKTHDPRQMDIESDDTQAKSMARGAISKLLGEVPTGHYRLDVTVRDGAVTELEIAKIIKTTKPQPKA